MTVNPADLTQATEMAAAQAKIAHGGYQHGDNAKDRTDELRARVAAIDVLVPRVAGPDRDRPMCWSWSDHMEHATATAGNRHSRKRGDR